MLRKINKFAPYAALALLGYLTNSALEENGLQMAQGKDLPAITKQMVSPQLVTAQHHASPADRDPFEVSWASYHEPRLGRAATAPAKTATTVPAEAEETPESQPASAPAIEELPPPPLPGRLTGVLLGDDFRTAIIEERLYKEGNLVAGDDPARCWTVEQIEQNYVILRFAKTYHTLRITNEDRSGDRQASRQGGPR
ncbi:MAG TPA: hypothetical protein PK082_04690 [Phycisphaerae bacterium]|nr:hypothetical protein [Phycisphaerae bacterium]